MTLDARYVSVPLPEAVARVHYDITSHLGSEQNNANAVIGWSEAPKARWQTVYKLYQDAAAMERFGFAPGMPVPAGVVTQGDPYGYPIDQYTTGYTTKLPPPADPVAAQNTPKSFNVPSVVARGSGSDSVSDQPGDNPYDFVESWTYGDATQQGQREQAATATDRLRALQAVMQQTQGTVPKEDLERILYG